MDVYQRVLWDEIIADVDEAEYDVNIDRQVLPQRDPFALSDEKFLKLFRLSKPLCQELTEIVTPFMRGPTRKSVLSVQTKVLAALRFLGLGSYQEITGSNHYVGCSQSSMSRCIKEFCDALNEPAIFNNWVQFPRNIEEMKALRLSFSEAYQFPGIIGCIDCTHVGIIAPPQNDAHFPEHVYVNRKNYHSINVQLICDNNLKIMNVNARFPGSTHDANIWRQSRVSEVLERVYRSDPRNTFFLIGDSGYPTRPWLLTPIANPTPGPQERFNKRFCSIRVLIERCNGVLKNRFRCLLKHRILHYSPTTASKIINSCVVLHNMCITRNVPEADVINEEVDYGIYAVEEVQDNGRVNPDLAAARQLQDNIIRNHFM